MSESVYFEEKQMFDQSWVRISYAIAATYFIARRLLIIFTMVKDGNIDHQVQINILHQLGIIAGVIAIGFILLKLLFLKLKITDKGIEYKFSPFHFRTQLIHWSEVRGCFIRKYRPIIEYGGWGYRIGFFGWGRAYNVSGNKGLQLVLSNNKRILFGTQKPAELEKALKKLNKYTG